MPRRAVDLGSLFEGLMLIRMTSTLRSSPFVGLRKWWRFVGEAAIRRSEESRTVPVVRAQTHDVMPPPDYVCDGNVRGLRSLPGRHDGPWFTAE